MISHSRPTISPEDVVAVQKQLWSGMISKNEIVQSFEQEISRYLNVLETRCFSSGRAALYEGLKLLEIKPGEEVIVPTYVCRSVCDAVRFAGGTPVIVDVAGDYTLSPEAAARAVTPRTRAMIVVHLFGHRACLDSLQVICERENLVMIEDIAQSIGAEYDGTRLGAFGRLSFGSTHATKMFTTGEGGFLSVNDEELSCRFRERDQGIGRGHDLSDLSASLGISQLKKLDGFLQKRAELAAHYIDNLQGETSFFLPMKDHERSVFFRFVVLVRRMFEFEKLRNRMAEQGVQGRKGVDCLLHHIEGRVSCPVADELFDQTVSLPLYPGLNKEEVSFICRQLKECI